MTRTIAETKMADGVTIRLIERDAEPRYAMTQSDAKIHGFPVPVADDLRMAKAIFETWIRKVSR